MVQLDRDRVSSTSQDTSAEIFSSIAYGGSTDVYALGAIGSPVQVVTAYSDFDTQYTNNAGISKAFDETGVPKLVDPSAGDFISSRARRPSMPAPRRV